MLAMLEIVLESQIAMISGRISQKQNFDIGNIILQAYLVPIEKDCKHNVRLYGTCPKNYCNHMWSIPIPDRLYVCQKVFDSMFLKSDHPRKS